MRMHDLSDGFVFVGALAAARAAVGQHRRHRAAQRRRLDLSATGSCQPEGEDRGAGRFRGRGAGVRVLGSGAGQGAAQLRGRPGRQRRPGQRAHHRRAQRDRPDHRQWQAGRRHPYPYRARRQRGHHAAQRGHLCVTENSTPTGTTRSARGRPTFPGLSGHRRAGRQDAADAIARRVVPGLDRGHALAGRGAGQAAPRQLRLGHPPAHAGHARCDRHQRLRQPPRSAKPRPERHGNPQPFMAAIVQAAL